MPTRTPDLTRVTGVALDVDGTLTRTDHQVTARTRAAVRMLTDAGLPVVLVTGRSRASTLALARDLGVLAPVAACNGSVVVDPVTGTTLRLRTLGPDEVTATVALGRTLPVELTWWTEDAIYVDRDGSTAATLGALEGAACVVDDPATAPARPVTKLMYHADADTLDRVEPLVRAHFPQVARSMATFLELVGEGASKWPALSFVTQRLAADPGRWLGVGDGGNDVEWLSHVGVPVAMGNARPEVLAVTAHRTGGNDDDGAAEVLERLAAALGLTVTAGAR